MASLVSVANHDPQKLPTALRELLPDTSDGPAPSTDPNDDGGFEGGPGDGEFEPVGPTHAPT